MVHTLPFRPVIPPLRRRGYCRSIGRQIRTPTDTGKRISEVRSNLPSSSSRSRRKRRRSETQSVLTVRQSRASSAKKERKMRALWNNLTEVTLGSLAVTCQRTGVVTRPSARDGKSVKKSAKLADIGSDEPKHVEKILSTQLKIGGRDGGDSQTCQNVVSQIESTVLRPSQPPTKSLDELSIIEPDEDYVRSRRVGPCGPYRRIRTISRWLGPSHDRNGVEIDPPWGIPGGPVTREVTLERCVFCDRVKAAVGHRENCDKWKIFRPGKLFLAEEGSGVVISPEDRRVQPRGPVTPDHRTASGSKSASADKDPVGGSAWRR